MLGMCNLDKLGVFGKKTEDSLVRRFVGWATPPNFAVVSVCWWIGDQLLSRVDFSFKRRWDLLCIVAFWAA